MDPFLFFFFFYKGSSLEIIFVLQFTIKYGFNMLLSVFGSTGLTDQEIIKKALSNGHQVIAHAQSVEKIEGATVSQITIIIGELTDNQAILKVLDGVDAVISVLGPVFNQTPGLPIPNRYKTIVECIEQKKC